MQVGLLPHINHSQQKNTHIKLDMLNIVSSATSRGVHTVEGGPGSAMGLLGNVHICAGALNRLCHQGFRHLKRSRHLDCATEPKSTS